MPGQSIFVRFLNDKVDIEQDWQYKNEPGNVRTLEGPWELSFTSGGPDHPPSTSLDRLRSWTEIGDTMANYFSGSAMYEASFHAKETGRYVLDLGEVRESARVWINGEEVGHVWSIPYEIEVSRYVKEGENHLKIEVVNLMANRIRYLDRQGISWRNYHEINFVNIDYKSFDASNWDPVPSGLLGPVQLIKY